MVQPQVFVQFCLEMILPCGGITPDEQVPLYNFELTERQLAILYRHEFSQLEAAMPRSKKEHPISPARRHFLGVSGAVACKAAAIAAVAAVTLPEAANAARGGNGVGWGGGVGGGRGHGGGGGGDGSNCFLKGTRILTAQGEACIEDLKIGDLVQTMRGELPVKWIGKQVFTRSGPTWHKSVMPIRVSASALGHESPSRDLYLSPNHALYIDGYLMPAKDLVNGRSIAPALPSDTDRLEYFNVVFDTHEVIWAERAAVESFGGGGIELFTNFAEYRRLYPNEPEPAKTAVALNLGTGRAHLYALLGLGASYFMDVCDPLQEAYERLAARAEELVA